jgi:L-seryl-tRNA(Ser) seleniumtransferase
MMDTPDDYERLGVRRVVNAATTLTALGGTVLPPEVIAAMTAASTSCVSMEELHLAAGRRLAQLTDNESALITSGCAAAIVLAVLATITDGRPELIAQMHHDTNVARNVVMHRSHRIPYDRAIELAGGRIVEIGNAIQTFEWELDAAIDEQTAAVFWVAGEHMAKSTLSLDETVSIAHSRGVPVIVDAAAQLPPVSNLRNFTRIHEVDLVTFSGGKGLQGPQASGLMVGRAELIEAARLNAAPFQRLARPMKVGKEEICGLVAAVERYLLLDHEAVHRGWGEAVDEWASALSALTGIGVQRLESNEAGQPVPRLEISLPSVDMASRVSGRLWDDDPRVAVLRVHEKLFVSPDTLQEGESELVVERLVAALKETF